MTSDIIGDLVTAEVDGEKLTDEAIISFLRLLLPAGLETTYRSSSNLLYLLLTHPDQLAALQQDGSLIPAAIEEALRYETPLVSVPRTATRDVEMQGITIPEGAQVKICASVRPIATKPGGPGRPSSTSTGSGARTSPLPAAYTAASACTWPGSRPARC